MTAFLSEIGHNNFYYATHTKVCVQDGATYEQLMWLSGAGNKRLQAIKIEKKYIIPLTIDRNYVNNILNNNNEYIVVWISKGV
jgi:hypothetical protein